MGSIPTAPTISPVEFVEGSFEPSTLSEARAGFVARGRVQRSGTGLHSANDALLVDHEDRALRQTKQGMEDSVAFRDLSVGVTEEGETKPQLSSKPLVRCRAADADAEDLTLPFIHLGETSLVRLQLASSSGGVRQNIEDQNHILLPTVVAELDQVSVLIEQGKVRRLAPHL